MTTVAIRELRNNTAEVIRRVQGGDEVTITQNGVPIAQMSAIRSRPLAPMSKAALLRLLDTRKPDPMFRADIEALAGDTTDDLDPLR